MSTKSRAAADPPVRPAGLAGDLDDEQVERLADLIGEGRFEFPADLSALDTERLRARVRTVLRNRLVRFIARALAHFLFRTTDHDPEVRTHA